MKLVEIDITTFKKDVYKHYKKLFPKAERKQFSTLRKCYKRNICSFLKIFNDEKFIGFMIVNKVKDISLIQLDYFAILPEYQNNGYGSMSLVLLKDFYSDYDGLFGEVETVGYGINLEENKIRERRIKFYKRLGFSFLNYELEFFNVIFTPCVYYFKDKKIKDDQIIKNMFDVYNVLIGEKLVKKKCKFKRL